MTNQRYSEELLRNAVLASVSIAGVLRYLGVKQTGGSHAHISRRLKKLEIDTSHFTGQVHNRGQAARNRLSPEQRSVVMPPGSPRTTGSRLMTALLSVGRSNSCEQCGIDPMWNGEPLVLHVDHVDGNYHNNRPENLRILCPNCHSQTSTYAGRSANRGLEPRLQPRADPDRQPLSPEDLTELMKRVLVGDLTAVQAARMIGCAYSTIRQLLRRFETTGVAKLAAPRRPRPTDLPLVDLPDGRATQ